MSERIRALVKSRIDELGLDMAKVSRDLGRNHAYVQQYVSRGVPRALPEDLRHKLADMLQLSESDLREQVARLGLNTPQIRNEGPSTNLSERVSLPPSGLMPKDVPVKGVAVAGGSGEFAFNGETIDFVRRPPGIVDAKEVFALFVSNASMSPRYEPGDLIYVSPNRPPRVGDDVVIELHGVNGEAGGCYLKRLVRRTADTLIAAQFNPARDDLEYEMASIKRVYRVLSTAELLGV